MCLVSRFEVKRSLTFHLSGMMAMLLLLFAAGSSARAQQNGSLADAARQMRAQKGQATPAATSTAQQVADELSEEQNDGAPGGFKTYHAGGYQMWIPAPYTIVGHDDGGTVLSGPQMGSTQPFVLAGTPVGLHLGGDDAFRDAAIQFAHMYAPTASCTQTTLANRAVYQCGLAGVNLLGHPVSGNALFIRGSGSIVPVFCVASTGSHARDIFNDPHSTLQQKKSARLIMDQEDQDVRNAWQKCDTVFQSVRVEENAAPPASAQSGKSGTDSARTTGVLTATTQATPASSAASPRAESTVPAGFKVHPFTYCRSQHDCWNASIVVPADAQLVSSDCKQYVFEMKVQGSPFLLLAGPAGGEGCGNRSSSDPSQVRWNELAAPENRRAPGTSNTISSQQTKLDGKPAIITQIGFRKGMTEWMGKRAEIESNGIPLVVGCMAPREHFADGETICSGLIGSLQLP